MDPGAATGVVILGGAFFLGVAIFVLLAWYRSGSRFVHRSVVTSSSARPRQTQQNPFVQAKRTGPGRLIAKHASHRPYYASASTSQGLNHSQNQDTRGYQAQHAQPPKPVPQFTLPSPIHSSAESSPAHSPYAPQQRPPSRSNSIQHHNTSAGRLLPIPASVEENWRSLEQTRSFIDPAEYGSYTSTVPGSIRVYPPSNQTDPGYMPLKGDNHSDSILPTATSYVKSESSFYKPPTTMKQIKIGIDLVDTFAKLSEENTNQNIETVAILAGVLMGSSDESNTSNTKFGELVVRGAPNGLSRSRGAQSEEEEEFFIVTHLIVPEQQGTHDTCEVLNDEVMPGLLAEYGLVQLGWIHVHPRYEAFLSSVDLHTHFSYQMMLPESIAIVWAPIASPNYGIFSLTPKGMRDIEKCDQRGFHTHPEGEAFTSSAHVRQDYNLPPIRVLDLRHDPSSSSSDEHSEHSGPHSHVSSRVE